MVTREDHVSPYRFPNRLSPFIRSNHHSPAIYRWSVRSQDSQLPEAVYIGEAENLSVRVQRVLTPGKAESRSGQTNKRLRREFDNRLAKRKKISLETAEFEDFEINGVKFSNQQLQNRFYRCALENLLIIVEQATGRDVLNRFETLQEKAARKLNKIFPMHRRRRYSTH